MTFLKLETRRDLEVLRLLAFTLLFVLFMLGAYLTPIQNATAEPLPSNELTRRP